jgi:uncharacterized membrane protein YoaK (UPF0700 family)
MAEIQQPQRDSFSSSSQHNQQYMDLLGLQDGSGIPVEELEYDDGNDDELQLKNETMLNIHPYIAIFMLSFVGGFVDAALFVSLFGLFTASVTGNLISIVAIGERERISRFTVTATFFGGAAFSSVVTNCAKACGVKKQKTIAVILLLIEATALIILSIAGWILKEDIIKLKDVDAPLSLSLGTIAAFAMGLQNGLCRECFSTFPQSTVLTSTLVAEAQHLVDFAFRKKTITVMGQSRFLYNLCPLVAFLSGAVLASFLIKTEAGYLCLLLPAFLIAVLALDVVSVLIFDTRRSSK